MRQPNFDNLLKILKCEVPERPTLFEFFMNDVLYNRLARPELVKAHLEDPKDKRKRVRLLIDAFKNAGYDYTTLHASEYGFKTSQVDQKETRSLNQGFIINDRETYEKYEWDNPDNYDYSWLGEFEDELPEGMKFIVFGPGGVLENVIGLTGYDNLCFIMYDDPELAEDIFRSVGEGLLRYYELSRDYNSVGAMISNDDWGFKTQLMLSPDQMREYVFPWHKKIVETIHVAGKPAILHSCGNLEPVMEDIIDDIGYDARHSFEDTIIPVEDAYEKWQGKIAILGGLDMDFICRASLEEIKERSLAMLERTKDRGGYALGTGNSIPEYVPHDSYLAMISVIKKDAKYFK